MLPVFYEPPFIDMTWSNISFVMQNYEVKNTCNFICAILMFSFKSLCIDPLNQTDRQTTEFWISTKCSAYNMTKPKFRPCPSCGIMNQASMKSCMACFKSISINKIKAEKKAAFDRHWAEGLWTTVNKGRIINSALIALSRKCFFTWVDFCCYMAK